MQSSTQLIKEFASINRWEYTPFCPICGREFESPTDMLRLTCQHYVCVRCRQHLQVGEDRRAKCPFDDVVSEAFCDGQDFAEELGFVKGWFKEAENPDPKRREEVIKQLMNSIETLRRGLNMNGVPCRVIIDGGTCSGRLNCEYDHKLTYYRKKRCPVASCPNERCMFSHELERPGETSRGEETKSVPPKGPQRKKSTKSIQPPKKKSECRLL